MEVGEGSQILFLSHTSRTSVFRVGSYHLSRAFASMGYSVAHISSPFSRLASFLHDSPGMREKDGDSLLGVQTAGDGVVDYVPRTIMPSIAVPRTGLKRWLREVGFDRPRYVLVDEPKLWRRGLFGPGTTAVYRPTDIYTRVSTRLREREAILSTAGVVATSLPVLDGLPLKPNRSLVVENGVDLAAFSLSLSQASEVNRRGSIYVGAIDERFDWDLLVRLALEVPGEAIDVAGPVERLAISELPTNVHLLGPVEYSSVSGLLSRYRVGLLPFVASAENSGRSPMKLFEYLAAGLEVLGPSTPPLKAHRPFVSCYSSMSEASLLYRQILAREPDRSRLVSYAQKRDWHFLASEISQFLLDLESEG